MCVLIALVPTVSYRSIPKILKTVFVFFGIKHYWLPHFSSVINWTIRAGINILNSIPWSANWTAIIDTIIHASNKKILVILRAPLTKNIRPLTLKQTECVGIHVLEKCTGDTVKSCLIETFAKVGIPGNIIKDQGYDLKLGVTSINDLLSDERKIHTIKDISHVIANALKAAYSKSEKYLDFHEKINTASLLLRYSSLSSFIPPNMRSKGRFQSISKRVKWADRILSLMKRKRNAYSKEAVKMTEKYFPDFNFLARTTDERLKDYVSVKLEEKLPDFESIAPFLSEFQCVTKTTDEIQKILKTQGLNKNTHNKVIDLAKIVPNSIVRTRIEEWAKEHINIYESININGSSIHVTSDILESLFGKFKYFIERAGKQDFNKLVSLLPLLCGQNGIEQIQASLQETKHKHAVAWIEKNIPMTSLQKRRKVFPADKAKKCKKTG